MADEIFNSDFRTPGQSVPDPLAPVLSAGFNDMPLDNSPPDAPIISVAGGGTEGNNGSIDPTSDRVLQWWLNQDTQAMHGPAVRSQFDAASPYHSLNNWSLQNLKAPYYMPSGALALMGGRSLLWSLVGATMGFVMPPLGKPKSKATKIAWGLGGFFFPTLTVGAVAVRQVVK